MFSAYFIILLMQISINAYKNINFRRKMGKTSMRRTNGHHVYHVVFMAKFDTNPKMPQFNEDEEEELRRMLGERDQFFNNAVSKKAAVSNNNGKPGITTKQTTYPTSASKNLPSPPQKPVLPPAQTQKGSSPSSSLSNSPPPAPPSLTSELIALAGLFDRGLISQEEFNFAKQDVIKRREASSPITNGMPQSSANNTSRMPTFNSQETEELNRILSDTDNMFKDNIPLNKINNAAKPTPPKPMIQGHVKPLLPPNNDWRAAMNAPAFYTTDELNKVSYPTSSNTSPTSSTLSNKSKRPQIETDFELEFDYSDMEAALMDEQFFGNTGEGGVGVKHSKVIKEHDGLRSGDLVPPYAWTWLTDAEGNPAEFSQAHKNTTDIVVLVADPRRINNGFTECIRQLNNIPKATLKIELAAVNCDDNNEQRRFLKKNKNNSYTLLSDHSRKMMDVLKCRTSTRLSSALIFIDVASSKILKIWYEDDWDAFTTRDLVVEELKAYRKNPTTYIQSQIGLR